MFLSRAMRSLPGEGLVVEIGGGSTPVARADVIVDKYLSQEGREQRGNADLVIDRPFIQADACLLPFADKSVDYLVASHVVEHIPAESIDGFFGEINRVAKAGFIEAPSILYEHMREIDLHRWFVDCQDGLVHLAPRTKSPWKAWLEPVFHVPQIHALVRHAPDLFATATEWRGELRYRVHDSVEVLLELHSVAELLERVKDANRHTPPEALRAGFVAKVGQRVRRWFERSLTHKERFAKRRDGFDWRSKCVCPLCHGCIHEINRRIFCSSCGNQYLLLPGDVPSFLIAKSQSSE